jgi:hypothetical protein
MICVSVMLAIYLVWPMAFGGERRGLESPAEAHAVAAVPQPKLLAASMAQVPEAPPQPESCYKRYQREVRQCSGGTSAACKLGAADHWDMCEATGFWPD